MHSKEILILIGVIVGSYLLGSIPFGVIVSKYAHRSRIDIQKTGSGNIGATNVGRKLGFGYGALVAGLDAWKGALPVIAVSYFLHYSLWFAGAAWLFAFLGHLFPVWLRFKGGKGISVCMGGLLGLLGWKTCLIIFGCWTIVFLFFTRRTMSATNLIVAAGLLIFIFALPALFYLAPITALIVFLIWWAHRKNIQRLSKGEEPSLKLKLPSLLNKLPDDVISFVIKKLQVFVDKIKQYQNQRKP